MKQLKCLIVDDEAMARNLIKEYVDTIPFLELVGTCKNAFEAIEALQEKTVDLMFLDIQMPGMIGTKLLESLVVKPKVIFITAYANYALESYDLDVVDYLMKPVSLERFTKAILKANDRIQKPDIQPIINFENKVEIEHIFVNVEYALVKIILDDISHIEGLKDYIKIFMVGQNRPILTKSTLKGIEERLPKEKFNRVHKSFIVNLKKIESIKAQRIKIGNFDIPISETNYEDLMKDLKIGGNG
jgi:two-component system, LytTR family, response regulator